MFVGFRFLMKDLNVLMEGSISDKRIKEYIKGYVNGLVLNCSFLNRLSLSWKNYRVPNFLTLLVF